MNIRHHLEDDLLVSYASGALSEGWSIAVASHLALCPSCRERLATAESVGGEMLDALPPEPIDALAWDRVQTLIKASSPPQPAPALASGTLHDLPQPLRDYVGGNIDAIKWRSLGKGASQMRIRTGDNQTQVRLLRIPAGKPVPEHSHGGRELTLVLSGSFHDEEGTFGPGDIEDADGSVLHQPIASPEADCICLAVTDKPLRFSSWIVRALQPVLGI